MSIAAAISTSPLLLITAATTLDREKPIAINISISIANFGSSSVGDSPPDISATGPRGRPAMMLVYLPVVIVAFDVEQKVMAMTD